MNYVIIELEFVNVELSIIVSKYLNSFNPHVYLHHLIKFIDTDVIIIIICIVKFSIGRIGNTKKDIGIAVQCQAIPEFPFLPAVALACPRFFVSNRLKNTET